MIAKLFVTISISEDNFLHAMSCARPMYFEIFLIVSCKAEKWLLRLSLWREGAWQWKFSSFDYCTFAISHRQRKKHTFGRRAFLLKNALHDSQVITLKLYPVAWSLQTRQVLWGRRVSWAIFHWLIFPQMFPVSPPQSYFLRRFQAISDYH